MFCGCVNLDKEKVRKRIRLELNGISFEMRRKKGLLIWKKLSVHPVFKEATSVLFFLSLRDEVDTNYALKHAIEQGKKVVVPVCSKCEDKMNLSRIYDPDAVVGGTYGVKRPSSIELFNKALDFALVPGIAYDKQGNRLGRGKGCYDKLLVDMPEVYKIGIGYEFQLIDHIPVENHDVRLDELLLV